MDILTSFRKKAAEQIKRVVLPEIADERTIDAAIEITREGFAHLDLVGEWAPIHDKLVNGGANMELITLHRPADFPAKLDEYASILTEKRKHRGMTFEKARVMMLDPMFYGAYLVYDGTAQGMVAGAACPTGDTIRAALFSVGTMPGCNLVSSFFIIVHPNKQLGANGVFVFADPSVNPNPDSMQLADIAIACADNTKTLLGIEPRVAMLSFSTKGSAKHEVVDKVIAATEEVKRRRPDILVDGEMQFDAAIIPSIGQRKAPNSQVAGRANVLVFPDLNACNIGSKIAERLGSAEAVGPVLQGLAKPINDLSRGCKPKDISDLTAITAIQARS